MDAMVASKAINFAEKATYDEAQWHRRRRLHAGEDDHQQEIQVMYEDIGSM